MRILLIEDDEKLCEAIRFQLEKEHFDVDESHDGEDGLFLIMERAHDLVLLDRMLPELDGLEVLKRIRKLGINTPVILVTALGELNDRVTGLNEGADDYIIKPFAFEELMARIHCIFRRPAAMKNTERLSFGDVTYEPEHLLLLCGEYSRTLSRREGRLLELFMHNPGQTMSRNSILIRVWGPEMDVEDGNLDNYIHFLRKSLRKVESRLVLTTIRGVGYRLEDKHV